MTDFAGSFCLFVCFKGNGGVESPSVEWSGVQSLARPPTARSEWVVYLASLSLYFIICKMGILTVPTSYML